MRRPGSKMHILVAAVAFLWYTDSSDIKRFIYGNDSLRGILLCENFGEQPCGCSFIKARGADEDPTLSEPCVGAEDTEA